MKGQSTEVTYMLQQIAQLFQDNSDIGMIIQTLFSFAFIIYLFYAQRIQATQMLRQIEVTLRKVKNIKDEGRKTAIDTVNRIGKPADDPTEKVDRFIESFVIGPVDLDPAGIIGKLDQVLKDLEVTREQLIDIGILVGTDFNPDGVKGIGPKTALKLIKKHGSIEETIPELKDAEFPAEPKRIREIFLNPKVSDNYKLDWKEPDIEGVVDFLCRERDFSEDRVRKALKRMTEGIKEAKSKVTLETWFGKN